MTSEKTYYLYDFFPVNGEKLTLLPKENNKYEILYAQHRLGIFKNLEEAFIATCTGSIENTDVGEILRKGDISGDLNDWTKKRFAKVSGLRPA